MRRSVKIKALGIGVLVRKTSLTASPASRRGFPAWIDAEGEAIAFPAKTGVTPRVRDALVLRTVSTKKSAAKGASHADGV